MIFFLYCIWFRLLQQCWNDNYTINWNSIFQTPSALIPKASLALRILFNISSSKEALKLILFPKYRKDFTNFKVMLSARIWCDGTLYWGLGNIRLLLWIGEGFGLYISFFFFFSHLLLDKMLLLWRKPIYNFLCFLLVTRHTSSANKKSKSIFVLMSLCLKSLVIKLIFIYLFTYFNNFW